MSDYLKNLQESNAIIHGFIRKTKPVGEINVQPLTEDDKSDEEDHKCEEGYKWCPKKEECVSIEDMGKDKIKEELSDIFTENEFREEFRGILSEEEINETWQSQWMSTAQQGELAAQGAGHAAIAIGVAAVAVKAYKRFFSQAAKACAGRSGDAKTSCMNKFKQKAQAAKVSSLQSGLSKCAKDKNPAKCKASLQKKIASEKAKMGQ